MRKHYLFAPGPTSVPPEVLLELAKPVLHHRERNSSKPCRRYGRA